MRGRLLLAVSTVALLATSVPAQAEPSWTPVTPAPPVPGNVASAAFFDVSAVSPADVWAVGNGWSDAEQPLIGHWTGAGWQPVTVPSMPDFQYSLSSVDAVSARDVWAVGNGMALPSPGYEATAVVAHYDGTAWSMAPAPTPPGYAALNDVDMTSGGDGWAVGWHTGALTEPLRPLVMRWRHGRWSTMTTPRIGDENVLLAHVHARTANDVWAVGSAGDSAVVLHFDGARWTVARTPRGDAGAGSFQTLRSVAAVSANEAWAVGDTCVPVDDTTDCTPLVLRMRDGVWRTVPPAGDHGTNLRDVVVRSRTDVWVVGYDLPPGGTETAHTEHWDGRRFTTVPVADGGISAQGQLASALDAATRLPGTTELWAVGWQESGPRVLRHG